MRHIQLHWKKIRIHWKKGSSAMITIPEGSTLSQMKNGDVLITFPGARAPYLCVQRDWHVRVAIVRSPVTPQLAEAARQYVMSHLTKEQSDPI